MKKYIYMLLICLVAYASNVNSADINKKSDEDKKQITHPSADVEIKRLANKHQARINWAERLDLTEEQKAYVDEIYKKDQPTIDYLLQQIADSQQKIRDIYKQENAAIREILDEQQTIKYDKFMIKIKKQNGEKFEGQKPSRKRMKRY